MMHDDPEVLVSTDWLAARLADEGLVVLDASWHMPAAGRDARAEHAAAHIPDARFFDIDAISDSGSALPHMAPPPEVFAAAARTLGLGDGRQVVIYDDSEVRSAARAWWTLRHMGLRGVAVLDGGLGKWRAEGRPLDSAAPAPGGHALTVARQPALVRDAAQVEEASRLGNASIVDSRAASRFRGDVPEPRPGLRSGHIPGSRNLPFGKLFAADGTMLPAPQLRAAFEAAGVDLNGPVITTCGSGVTAAILSLALERIGHRDHALYDGSWTEWGSLPDLNIATGDA